MATMRQLSRYARVGWCERTGVVAVTAVCSIHGYRLTAEARAKGRSIGGTNEQSIQMRLALLGWDFKRIYERHATTRRVEVRGVTHEDSWKHEMPIPLTARFVGLKDARWHAIDLIPRDEEQRDPITLAPIDRKAEVREFFFSSLRGRYESRRWFLRDASAVRIKQAFYPETGGPWPTAAEMNRHHPTFDRDGFVIR